MVELTTRHGAASRGRLRFKKRQKPEISLETLLQFHEENLSSVHSNECTQSSFDKGKNTTGSVEDETSGGEWMRYNDGVTYFYKPELNA